MRKYANVDIIAALGAVVELNTENYKSDFKYDIEMFREAALQPSAENRRFLWLSRPSGTYCFCQVKTPPHILNEKPATLIKRGPIFTLYGKKPWTIIGLSTACILVDFSIGLRSISVAPYASSTSRG